MRRVIAVAGVLAVAAVAAAPAGAVGEREVAPDGRAVAFTNAFSYSPADTDDASDVFAWNRGVFDFVSEGPGSDRWGAKSHFVSDDGTRVLFETRDALLPSDTDSSVDLYERVGGVTQLVSTGPADTGAAFDARYGAASNDGTRVYFDTLAQLVPEDTDDLRDIYLRTADGTVTLASPTPAGVGAGHHRVVATSRNGLRLLDQTDESMTPGDNSGYDIFERFEGTITLVTRSLVGPVNNDLFGVMHVTPDARSLLVLTEEKLTAGDQNEERDIYQFSRGRTTLVTSNSEGVSGKCEETRLPPPLGTTRGLPPCYPWAYGQSDDGGQVLFSSSKPLATKPGPLGLPVTTATGGVLEKRASGETRLIDDRGGGPSMSSIAADGSRYVVQTVARHSAADTDDAFDIYRIENGQATLLSGSTPDFIRSEPTVTPDARRVFFTTEGRLVPEDTDNEADTYVDTDTGPRLAFGSDGTGLLIGSSENGDRWFFLTSRALVAEDTDSEPDLYIRHADGTTRVLSP